MAVVGITGAKVEFGQNHISLPFAFAYQ